MKTTKNKKRLILIKATIAQLNHENMTEIEDSLQQIKGGAQEVPSSEFGSTCQSVNSVIRGC